MDKAKLNKSQRTLDSQICELIRLEYKISKLQEDYEIMLRTGKLNADNEKEWRNECISPVENEIINLSNNILETFCSKPQKVKTVKEVFNNEFLESKCESMESRLFEMKRKRTKENINIEF